MKKFFYSTVMVLAVMVSAVCLTSCGGNDDEPETPANSNVGKHKIEIALSGDVSAFYVSYAFSGITTDGNASPVCDANGKDQGLSYTNSGEDGQWSSVMAYTGNNAAYLTVGLVAHADEVGKTLTVTFKGYINDKLVQTATKTLTSKSEYDSWAFGFFSNDGLKEVY